MSEKTYTVEEMNKYLQKKEELKKVLTDYVSNNAEIEKACKKFEQNRTSAQWHYRNKLQKDALDLVASNKIKEAQELLKNIDTLVNKFEYKIEK